MLVSLTVGKVDAGVAVLLTEDKRLIEFPSILLPSDIISGSVVDIDVSRNFDAEHAAARKFDDLQTTIFELYGRKSPSPPVLRCRNATQTSVVLEWDPMELATAELRSLSLFRNGVKAGNVPRDKLSTKISGLAIDTQYTFQLVLRTTGGTFNSERLSVRTQKMTDLTGITITPGILPHQLREDIEATAARISAKIIDTVRIDTTHFICTEGRGPAWEKAVEMNVPVVVPDWLKGCEREGRIVGVRGYYLDADPKNRQIGPSVSQQAAQQQQQQQQQQLLLQQQREQEARRQEQRRQQEEVRRQEDERQRRQQQQQQEEEEERGEAHGRRRDEQDQQLSAPSHVQRQSSISILGTQPHEDGPRIEHTPPTPEQIRHERRALSDGGSSPASRETRSRSPHTGRSDSDEVGSTGRGHDALPQRGRQYGTSDDRDKESESEEDPPMETPAGESQIEDDRSEASFATDTGGRRDSDHRQSGKVQGHDGSQHGPFDAERDDSESETPQENKFDEVDL